MPDCRISRVRFEALAFLPWAFPAWRSLSAGSHAPDFRGLPIASFLCKRRLSPALCLTTALLDGTAKCPESLCPMLVLPHRGDVYTTSCEDITPRSSLLRTHSPIPSGSSFLRPWPRARSLRRLLPAPAATGIFPTLSLRIFPRMLGPLPRRSHEVRIPVSSSVSSAFPQRGLGRLPASIRDTTSRGGVFEAADIPLCSGLRVCSSPRSFLPLHIVLQGSRDFYIRGRTCFVASARTGSASRPNTGN